jgi:hypothetical protein
VKNSVLEHLMESYSDVPHTTEPPSSDSMKNEEKNTRRKKQLQKLNIKGRNRIRRTQNKLQQERQVLNVGRILAISILI